MTDSCQGGVWRSQRAAAAPLMRMPSAIVMPFHASVIGPRWMFGSMPMVMMAIFRMLPRARRGRLVCRRRCVVVRLCAR